MRWISAVVLGMMVLSPGTSFAQSGQGQGSAAVPAPSVSVPRLINVNGIFRPADGQPIGRVETVTFAIYAEETGGTPLWQETQAVEPDSSGRYVVLLGATRPEGVPVDVFASGEARWLGMLWARGGESQARRSRLTFVPYAVRAADADTLGGRPASAYALAPAPGSATGSEVSDPAGAHEPTGFAILPGVPESLAKYANATDITPSAVFENGGRLGINTTVPGDIIHSRFTNTDGTLTGLAVQNMGNSGVPASGMLFYDQFNNVANFQGFNNLTHEYRINNVAKNGSNVFNGSINFMIGSTSRFFVGSNGSIGINQTNPVPVLDISNINSTQATANIASTTYQTGGLGSLFTGRKARGTAGAPSAVLNGDTLGGFQGKGYGASAFGTGGGGVFVQAWENWTDAAQGTALRFQTTRTGTTSQVNMMTLNSSGDLGIGTAAPAGALEIARSTGDYDVVFTAYAGEPNVWTRKARGGNPAAPTGALAGDELGTFAMTGYGSTDWGLGGAGMFASAAENFTDTANGTRLIIFNTPIGSTDIQAAIQVLPAGKVGIAMPSDISGAPLPPLDMLQVFGDIRVGTTGTNGCLKDFSGNPIAGSCSSDLRLKKDVTPFGAMLDRLTALQPVHYYWRASEFPERHFGSNEAAGLIAQDVEKVLPELVDTDKDGFKTVNYSKLPLFTIQAVKELRSENDALKERVTALEPLNQRVAELERRLAEALAALGRR